MADTPTPMRNMIEALAPLTQSQHSSARRRPLRADEQLADWVLSWRRRDLSILIRAALSVKLGEHARAV